MTIAGRGMQISAVKITRAATLIAENQELSVRPVIGATGMVYRLAGSQALPWASRKGGCEGCACTWPAYTDATAPLRLKIKAFPSIPSINDGECTGPPKAYTVNGEAGVDRQLSPPGRRLSGRWGRGGSIRAETSNTSGPGASGTYSALAPWWSCRSISVDSLPREARCRLTSESQPLRCHSTTVVWSRSLKRSGSTTWKPSSA